MDYPEALAWVHSLRRMAEKTGLARMRAMLAALGNPQRRLAFVHVAGTNGKGSTVAMTASVLRAAGYKTGANISPFVLDFRERFLLNGEMVGEARLASLLTEVRAAAETLDAPAIEFEVVTATALLYFAQEECDIVCLEAGIGGRLDSTNVVENTLVACIAKIGFDHTEMLGDTLAAIAGEKCGIFKNRCDVISYPAQEPEAAAVIAERARQAGCPLTVPAAAHVKLLPRRPFENPVLYNSKYRLDIPFLGMHQAYNAAVVVEAALALRRRGYAIADEHIREGIAAARFPARIEVFCTQPPVILDGAHNADSATALADTLRAEGVRGLCAVVGVLRDKQADTILRAIAPFANTLYAVAPESPRALPAEELAALAQGHFSQVQACASVAEAVAAALGQNRGVLVCGSLYLASQARPLLLAQANLER